MAGLYFIGTVPIQLPFGEGIRCAGGGVTRLYPIVFAMGGVAVKTLNFGAPNVAANVLPGSSLNFQLWFRDAMGGPIGFNLSDGLNVVWQ